MMKTLPENLKKYKQTPEFTEHTVPLGLLKNHNTKAGVWGKIIVFEGCLEYQIQGCENGPEQLNPDHPGVVEPETLHHVTPKGKVRFCVEFYK